MERKFERKTEQDQPLGNMAKTNKNKDFDLESETLTDKEKKKEK